MLCKMLYACLLVKPERIHGVLWFWFFCALENAQVLCIIVVLTWGKNKQFYHQNEKIIQGKQPSRSKKDSLPPLALKKGLLFPSKRTNVEPTDITTRYI